MGAKSSMFHIAACVEKQCILLTNKESFGVDAQYSSMVPTVASLAECQSIDLNGVLSSDHTDVTFGRLNGN